MIFIIPLILVGLVVWAVDFYYFDQPHVEDKKTLHVDKAKTDANDYLDKYIKR